MDTQPHILVVDDDQRLLDLLRRYLADNDFRVSTATDAADARRQLEGFAFDLIVLDRMMPGEDGIAFATSVRRAAIPTPILMLSALGDIDHRIGGLEAGVDDYLPKPFEPRELLLRIQTILRRVATPVAAPDSDAGLNLNGYRFDADREMLVNDQRAISLTSTEASLLRVLGGNPGRILSREELTEMCAIDGGVRTVDVQVTRLRRKIEPDPRQPRYLQTVRGQGYVLRPD